MGLREFIAVKLLRYPPEEPELVTEARREMRRNTELVEKVLRQLKEERKANRRAS